jgi:hypothetical protein
MDQEKQQRVQDFIDAYQILCWRHELCVAGCLDPESYEPTVQIAEINSDQLVGHIKVLLDI